MKVDVRGDLLDNCRYLGDGAYVGFRGHDFVIFATDGIRAHDVVYLDSRMIQDLNKYVQESLGIKEDDGNDS